MSEKLCIFCERFSFEHFEGGDYPSGGLCCYAGHYYDLNPSDTEEYRDVILKANTCPDYQQVKP